MGTLSANKMATTYLNLVFQKADNKMYYTNGSDVDTEITTFASGITFTTAITASAGVILGNNIVYNSASEACITLDTDQGVSITATKVLYVDTVSEKTSANGVVIDSVTCKDGNLKLGGNVLQASDGGSTITLDTSDNVAIAGDLTVNGGDVTILAGEDDGASILMQADESDINGQDWKIRVEPDFSFTLGNNISGSLVNHLTFTPHATVASSYVTIPGTIRTTKLEYTDGDDALTIANGGGLTTGAALNVTGDLTVTGNDIISSSATAITMSGANVALQGNLTVAGTSVITGLTTFTGNAVTGHGAGIDGGSPVRQRGWIEKIGGVTKTSIYVDLTGLASINVDKDVIGLAAGGAAYIATITTAVNGTIFAIKMTCLEVPATGSPDIDLYNTDDNDEVYNNPLVSGSSSEYLIIDSNGNWTNGMIKGGTTITFGATEYLYLVNGAASGAGTYTTGKFLIELWGA